MTTNPSLKLLAERFRMVEAIGQGSMGVVYRGLDIAIGQPVAIKHLHPELIRADPDNLRRFEREVEALGRLNHPNIVNLHANLRDGQDYYLVLEYLEGGDLSALVKRSGRLSVSRTLRLGIELADALTRAHHLGVVHRALSSVNIMLAGDGTPKLTDFGVARLDTHKHRAATGRPLGAPDYLSPEALQGLELDARADLWALGVVLFELLAGRTPFSAGNIATILTNIATQPPQDLELLCPAAPPALVDLIYRLLTKDREVRVSSARRAGAEMEQILTGIEAGMNTPLPQAAGGLDRFRTPTPLMSVANHNLPAQATPFIGRERELNELKRLIQDPNVRLITVMGTGGIGKTRLALACAHRVVGSFVDGIFFVPLAPLSSADDLVQTLGHTLNMDFAQDLAPKTQLLDYLRGRALFLVMDNWDHLLDGLPLLAEILQTAPRVQVLATSRVKLNLQGETIFAIDGLDYPDTASEHGAQDHSAVGLFAQAARRAKPGFELTPDSLPDVVTITQMLEGMPLGIELAAAWTATMTPRDIVREMRANLDFLGADSGDSPDGHPHSLRAVFESSWRLLSNDEREVFVRIAVFRGRFTRSAGQAVSGASIRQLMGLANKSLLRRDTDSGIYHIHEVSRQFAEEKLTQWGEAQAVRDAHARFYLKELADVRRDLEGRRQLEVLDEIEADLENIRAGWRWASQRGLHDDLRDGMYTLCLYFLLRGELSAGVECLTDTAAALQTLPPTPSRDSALGASLLWQAALTILSGREARSALPVLAAAQPLIAASGDPFHRALMRFIAAYGHLTTGDIAQARERFAESRDLYTAIGENYQVAAVYTNWARTYWYRLPPGEADLARAQTLLTEALAALGDEPGLYLYAYILMNQSMVESMLGSPQAEASAREALSMYRRLRNMFGVTSTLNSLAIITMQAGRLDDARQYAAENVRVHRHLGGASGLVGALLGQARVEIAAGDYIRALSLVSQAAHLTRSSDTSTRHKLDVLLLRAEVEAALGGVDLASRLLAYVGQTPQAGSQQRAQAGALTDQLRVWLSPGALQEAASHAAAASLDEMVALASAN
jgi:predicted ATPase